MAGQAVTPKSIQAARRRSGGSNVGRRRKTSGPRQGPFVGPSGGAPAGSFPVTNRAQWKAALQMAHNAPNPSGIRAAANRIARARGWISDRAEQRMGGMGQKKMKRRRSRRKNARP